MTKKHFKAIAQGFADQLARGGNSAKLRTLAENQADTFAQINPRFNRALFLEACGFGG